MEIGYTIAIVVIVVIVVIAAWIVYRGLVIKSYLGTCTLCETKAVGDFCSKDSVASHTLKNTKFDFFGRPINKHKKFPLGFANYPQRVHKISRCIAET